MLMETPFLLRNLPHSPPQLPFPWISPSYIVAFVIITWQASESSCQVCEACKAGKMHADPFPTLSTRASCPLQLVHSDVYGPVKVSTHQGYCFWVSFINDFSHFKAVYLLKHKSETFGAFKQFKAWAENLTGERMGSLQDDKGGEHMSSKFKAFCINHGIQRLHTVRNRPQQNGMVERANRTIKEGVISMLYESEMPPSFWGELWLLLSM